ncbi:MAG: hypothetical protein JWM42_1450 [Burkholderia sp.]|nr:hypothetical protein [Burkholderia sp.]
MISLPTHMHVHLITLSRRANALGSALVAVTVLSSCGGGGSSSGGSAATGTQPANTTSPMTMSCVEGAGYQCSGGSIIRFENGVALTSSGVQAYGKSTSDLARPVVEKTTAYGLSLASGGTAEIRLAKDANGAVSKPVLLLSNLGLSWDGKNERPPIIELFNPLYGRSRLNPDGSITADVTLPDSSDLRFFDFADKGPAATQSNYANNRYFPRIGNPSRCLPEVPRDRCPAEETKGAGFELGDWRRSGSIPDHSGGGRLHGDGDIHAGDGKPAANGTATVLPGGSGKGVPFPGSKGYRSLDNWSYQYGNLGAWITQDTVQIVEWTPGSDEHSKIRRGVVAFGDVSAPASVPTTGTATYSGTAYGWHAANATQDPVFFRGTAMANVNFATREVIVTLQNAVRYDASGTAVPVSFRATTTLGAAGAPVASYLTGAVDIGGLKGGLSGRLFGPVNSTGASGAGAAEIGGAFSLSNAGGAAVVGGFIGRKQ